MVRPARATGHFAALGAGPHEAGDFVQNPVPEEVRSHCSRRYVCSGAPPCAGATVSAEQEDRTVTVILSLGRRSTKKVINNLTAFSSVSSPACTCALEQQGKVRWGGCTFGDTAFRRSLIGRGEVHIDSTHLLCNWIREKLPPANAAGDVLVELRTNARIRFQPRIPA